VEFSQADYLKKNTIVRGLNEMKTEAEFSGTAQFEVIKRGAAANQSKEDVSLYEEYTGRYKLARNIEIAGVAKFDEPHLSVSKVGKTEPAGGTFIDYTITVVNDGNRALGPIYVLDLFPPGTQYVHSSLRPSEQNGSYARWTLVSLGIGASTTIDLKLNMTEDVDNLVNRVQATGSYDGQWIKAENYSAIQFNWLSCCPPQIWAAKTAYVAPKDSTMVHYSIAVRNREKYVMAVSIIDQLPGGMMFQNSSLMPADHSSDWVSWNIIDLRPGETRIIDYLAKAMYNGAFVNRAHIEAHAVDGPDVVAADVAARVEIGTGPGRSSSSWQPPACFGLNCTSGGTKDEWIPCDACGTAEPEPPVISCSSCAADADDGYDIP
jgi:large repetitive protein